MVNVFDMFDNLIVKDKIELMIWKGNSVIYQFKDPSPQKALLGKRPARVVCSLIKKVRTVYIQPHREPSLNGFSIATAEIQNLSADTVMRGAIEDESVIHVNHRHYSGQDDLGIMGADQSLVRATSDYVLVMDVLSI